MNEWRVRQLHEPENRDEKVDDLAGFEPELNEMARRGWIEFYQDVAGVERVTMTPAGRLRAQRAMRERR